MEKRITEEVDRLTKPYEGTMTRKEFEGLQDLLSDIFGSQSMKDSS